MVYFLTNAERKYIKIGYTKHYLDINKRIRQLSTGSSSKLYLCGYILDGTKDLEKECHKMFKRVNLEWFDVTDGRLIDYINKNNDHPVYVDIVDGQIMVYEKIEMIKG